MCLLIGRQLSAHGQRFPCQCGRRLGWVVQLESLFVRLSTAILWLAEKSRLRPNLPEERRLWLTQERSLLLRSWLDKRLMLPVSVSLVSSATLLRLSLPTSGICGTLWCVYHLWSGSSAELVETIWLLGSQGVNKGLDRGVVSRFVDGFSKGEAYVHPRLHNQSKFAASLAAPFTLLLMRWRSLSGCDGFEHSQRYIDRRWICSRLRLVLAWSVSRGLCSILRLR